MINEFNGHSLSGQAAEALTEYRLGNLEGSGLQNSQISIADTAERVIGVIPQSYASGEAACLIIDGIGLLEVDGTVAVVPGDYLKPNAASTGIGIKAASNNDHYGAQALEPVASGTKVIRVKIVSGVMGA
jgi:hypothetical protein